VIAAIVRSYSASVRIGSWRPRPLVPAPLLDDVAEVHPAPAEDVLHRVPRPGAGVSTRDAVAVEAVGHRADRVLGELVPDAPDDRRLLGHDDELPGPDELTSWIPEAPITEGVVAPVAAVLEEPPLDAGHPLRVEVALELGGEAQLAEQMRASASTMMRWPPGSHC
jgi:hypothetical protein